MSHLTPRRLALAFSCAALFGTATTATAAADPAISLDKSTALVAAGDTVTVTGSGFSTAAPVQPTNAGLYVALVGPNFDSSSMSSPSQGAKLIQQSAIVSSGGSFTATIDVKSVFGSGANAVDCRQVQCSVRVWKAHLDSDPSQRVTAPVSFAPEVTLDRSKDLVAAGDEITVTGAGFKASAPSSPDNAGLYVALVGPDFDSSKMDSPSQGAVYLPQAGIVSGGGSFTTKLKVKAAFGGVDCLAVTCSVRVWKAHRDTDASQRVLVPVSFAGPQTTTDTTTTPVATPPAVTTPAAPAPTAPAAVVPAKTTPALTKLSFGRTQTAVTVSEASTLTATIAKRSVKRVRKAGKLVSVVRWTTVRTVKTTAGAAGRYTLKAKLAKGRYRVTVRATSVAGVRSAAKTATLTVK